MSKRSHVSVIIYVESRLVLYFVNSALENQEKNLIFPIFSVFFSKGRKIYFEKIYVCS